MLRPLSGRAYAEGCDMPQSSAFRCAASIRYTYFRTIVYSNSYTRYIVYGFMVYMRYPIFIRHLPITDI